MDAFFHVISGLIMHANPIGMHISLPYEHFIGAIQMGLVMVLAGLAMIGLTRSGFRHRQAAVPAVAMALLSAAYLLVHGGNPFGFAAHTCIAAGGIFRFVGGVGVAVGFACLLGIGRHDWRGGREDLFNPVVLATSAIYAVFCLEPLGSVRVSSMTPHIWIAISVVAAWISFGGLYGVLRANLRCHQGEHRLLMVMAGGVMLLVLMSFVASPGYVASELVYSGCFPAGITIGFFGQLTV